VIDDLRVISSRASSSRPFLDLREALDAEPVSRCQSWLRGVTGHFLSHRLGQGLANAAQLTNEQIEVFLTTSMIVDRNADHIATIEHRMRWDRNSPFLHLTQNGAIQLVQVLLVRFPSPI
jgi:hypothetical protein